MNYFINFNNTTRLAHLQDGLDDALEACKEAACGINTTGITLRYLESELVKGNYESGHTFNEPSKDGKSVAGTGSINVGWINLCFNVTGEITTIRFGVNQDTDEDCNKFFKAYKRANGIDGQTSPALRRSFYRYVYKQYFKSI